MLQRGPRALCLVGPSGSGKSTLIKKLLKDHPDRYGFSVSHTTRKPRPGEKDGVHYHFTTKENMTEAIEKGEFIEHAVFSGNMYGTSKQAVEAVNQCGKTCVLDIEIEGVRQIKKTNLNPLLVFVKVPSLGELEKRLKDRQTETEDSIAARLEKAKEELEYGETPGNFHLILVNDDFDRAYAELKDFIAQHGSYEIAAGNETAAVPVK